MIWGNAMILKKSTKRKKMQALIDLNERLLAEDAILPHAGKERNAKAKVGITLPSGVEEANNLAFNDLRDWIVSNPNDFAKITGINRSEFTPAKPGQSKTVAAENFLLSPENRQRAIRGIQNNIKQNETTKRNKGTIVTNSTARLQALANYNQTLQNGQSAENAASALPKKDRDYVNGLSSHVRQINQDKENYMPMQEIQRFIDLHEYLDRHQGDISPQKRDEYHNIINNIYTKQKGYFGEVLGKKAPANGTDVDPKQLAKIKKHHRKNNLPEMQKIEGRNPAFKYMRLREIRAKWNDLSDATILPPSADGKPQKLKRATKRKLGKAFVEALDDGEALVGRDSGRFMRKRQRTRLNHFSTRKGDGRLDRAITRLEKKYPQQAKIAKASDGRQQYMNYLATPITTQDSIALIQEYLQSQMNGEQNVQAAMNNQDYQPEAAFVRDEQPQQRAQRSQQSSNRPGQQVRFQVPASSVRAPQYSQQPQPPAPPNPPPLNWQQQQQLQDWQRGVPGQQQQQQPPGPPPPPVTLTGTAHQIDQARKGFEFNEYQPRLNRQTAEHYLNSPRSDGTARPIGSYIVRPASDRQDKVVVSLKVGENQYYHATIDADNMSSDNIRDLLSDPHSSIRAEYPNIPNFYPDGNASRRIGLGNVQYNQLPPSPPTAPGRRQTAANVNSTAVNNSNYGKFVPGGFVQPDENNTRSKSTVESKYDKVPSSEQQHLRSTNNDNNEYGFIPSEPLQTGGSDSTSSTVDDLGVVDLGDDNEEEKDKDLAGSEYTEIDPKLIKPPAQYQVLPTDQQASQLGPDQKLPLTQAEQEQVNLLGRHPQFYENDDIKNLINKKINREPLDQHELIRINRYTNEAQRAEDNLPSRPENVAAAQPNATGKNTMDGISTLNRNLLQQPPPAGGPASSAATNNQHNSEESSPDVEQVRGYHHK